MGTLERGPAGSDEADAFEDLAWLAEDWEERGEPQDDFCS